MLVGIEHVGAWTELRGSVAWQWAAGLQRRRQKCCKNENNWKRNLVIMSPHPLLGIILGISFSCCFFLSLFKEFFIERINDSHHPPVWLNETPMLTLLRVFFHSFLLRFRQQLEHVSLIGVALVTTHLCWIKFGERAKANQDLFTCIAPWNKPLITSSVLPSHPTYPGSMKVLRTKALGISFELLD